MSPTAYLQAFKDLNRDVRLFMVSVVVSGVCYMGLYFLLINLYLLRLGYELEFIGVFVSTGAFSFAVFSLPAGMAGRRFGSRRPMLLGMGVLMLGLGALSVAAWVPAGWRSAWLIFFCGLRELGHAFYMVNTPPYLMGATTAAERDFAFSLRGTLTPVAAFFGSLIGGVLPRASAFFFGWAEDDPANYMAPLMLSSLLLLPGLVAVWLIREVATETAEPGERGVPKNALVGFDGPRGYPQRLAQVGRERQGVSDVRQHETDSGNVDRGHGDSIGVCPGVSKDHPGAMMRRPKRWPSRPFGRDAGKIVGPTEAAEPQGPCRKAQIGAAAVTKTAIAPNPKSLRRVRSGILRPVRLLQGYNT